jgi:NAD(P)-dependent dehydrogenase (short-subunit alcohol dehydrogenase family)
VSGSHTGSLDHKTIVVTGGSSGLGRAMALAFGRKGAHVVVADVRRDPRAGGTATDEALTSEGGSAIFVETDVSHWEDIDRAVETAVAESGRLDVMVNSAVYLGTHSKGILETSEDDWDALMAVNFRGVFLCCKRALGQMVAQEPVSEVRGRIINMASQMGLVGTPGHVAYCALKGGIVNMTRQLAVDFGPQGILVNAIAPGKVPTHPLVEDEGERESLEYSISRTPFHRLGRPQDVAGMAAYLASDECNFVSGATLPVDGGWLAY